jgi:hypothetical protein
MEGIEIYQPSASSRITFNKINRILYDGTTILLRIRMDSRDRSHEQDWLGASSINRYKNSFAWYSGVSGTKFRCTEDSIDGL